MDIVAIDTIITDVRYIMTAPATMFAQAMLTLMIADPNTEVRDIAVRPVSTKLRKVNEPASQKNINRKHVIRPGQPIQTGTSRKPSGYGKVIPKEPGSLQRQDNRIRKEAGRLQRRQAQAEPERTITAKIPAL
jgi:hypothetical protein